MTVGEYVRARRMTLAAQELSGSNAKVIDVAVKYGYDSPDSFARAFQRFHGITPSQARAPGGLWAEFTCKGPLPDSLQRVNTQIWSEWLPALTGYALAGNYSLEVYMPPAEKPEDNVSYICIPLKRV